MTLNDKEKETIQELLEGGFDSVYSWTDGPGGIHTNHEHPFSSMHIVLEGQITIFADNKEAVYREGGRFNVPAGKIHSAKAGPLGCKYVVGEKY